MPEKEEKPKTEASLEIDELRTIDALESRTYAERFLQFNPEFSLFRHGVSLGVNLIHFLGDAPPKDNYDRTQRDLASDTIDSLWLAEHALLRGYENHSLSLLRRAYETISLMAYFFNYPDKLAQWENGGRIRQSAIRLALHSAPYPEPKETLDEMYRVYSLFTHVNRETIYHRLLGEPNRLTLGCQGNSAEINYASVLRELLRQTSWFVDVANFVFLKIGLRPPDSYTQEMLRYRGRVVELALKLPALFSEHPAGGSVPKTPPASRP